ncbi:hypothetical protein VspSTUT11_17170 [Vibrio sp. STUT-A11]|nr:hypothetical protein VspSTUT11_17170 [Vibrio sp. STUT-A11]
MFDFPLKTGTLSTQITKQALSVKKTFFENVNYQSIPTTPSNQSHRQTYDDMVSSSDKYVQTVIVLELTTY